MSTASQCRPIRLLVIDIDGCLIEGEKAPYDFDGLAALRDLNRSASPSNAIPPITICSGRPYPYVEAMLKLIDGQFPAIFEHGCGLYFPHQELRYECRYHPDVAGASQALEELAARVARQTGAGRQCAKGGMVTFFPPPGDPPEELARSVARQVQEAGLPLAVSYSMASVDITPRGIDKGSGLHWLLEELNGEGWDITPDQVAGVGDSPSDLSFLELVGFAAAPANAAAHVQAAADYVSPFAHTQGTLDIARRVVELNGGD